MLQRKDKDHGRQTLPTPHDRYLRRKTVLLLLLLLNPAPVQMSQKSVVSLSPGPTTGLLTQEIPNLLLTDHRTITQLVYVDLDIEKELQKVVSLKGIHDVTALMWYANHVERSKDSIKDILAQAEKTIVTQQPPSSRPRRAIGFLGVMAILTVVGILVGTTMNAVNSVSINEVKKKNLELQNSLGEIRESLAIQHENNDKIVRIIKDTIVVASLQTDRLDHVVKMQEDFMLKSNLFFSFMDPILFFTNNYLRQIETDINNLIRAYIPLHFVDVHLVRQALATLHGPDLDPAQIRIAFEAGTAIPMYIDVENLQISFLLSIPLVKKDKIYQLKNIVNVGTWEGDTKTKINAPALIAYQNSSDVYLVPNLQHCQIFKDTNYLCPGNPFLPMKDGFLCGLERTATASTVCDVTITRSSDVITEAILVNNMWLVSTNARNMSITYTKHGTFSTKPIPYSTFTTVVPKDVIISIGTETLFHVSSGNLEGGTEVMNTFKAFSIPHDTDLDFLLDKKQSHSLQLLLKQDNISISDMKFTATDSSFFNTDTTLQILAHSLWNGSVVIWLLVISITIVMHHRYIRRATERETWRRREFPVAVV